MSIVSCASDTRTETERTLPVTVPAYVVEKVQSCGRTGLVLSGTSDSAEVAELGSASASK